MEKIEYSEAVTKLSICTPKLQKIIPLNFISNIQTQSAMMKIVTIFTGRASATFTKRKKVIQFPVTIREPSLFRKSSLSLGNYVILFCSCYHLSEQQSRQLARSQQMQKICVTFVFLNNERLT